MELELLRTYFPNGTNGFLYYKGKQLCCTIELPWLENRPQISCIPEGRYELSKRFSKKYHWHLEVMNVAHRSCILIHPANDAQKQLKGCIAPVSILTAEGKGLQSRKAMDKIFKMVFPALENDEKVFLTIKAVEHELN
jgi:hypothetical protein